MGMYLHLFQVDPENVDSEWNGARSEPETVDEAGGNPAGSVPSLSLEKAWHGLHYLMSGSAAEGEEPWNFLLLGGEPLGDDTGYGPPRYFDPDSVRRLNLVLRNLSDEQLWSRFDADTMENEGVYPGIWDEEEADLKEEYLEYFHELKDFMQKLNEHQKGMIIAMM